MTTLRCKTLLAAGLVALWLVAPTTSASEEREAHSRMIDATRSHAGFRLKAMLVVGVQGQFGEVGGALRVDPAHAEGWVEAVINTDTLRMDDADREAWARSPEFFDSARFPRIVFRSDPVPLRRLRNGGDLPGTLTVRGVSRPLKLTLLHGQCSNPGVDCPIRATGNIIRSEYGMRSRRAVLGDRVQLDLSVFLQGGVPHH